jgi:hypothetical protein
MRTCDDNLAARPALIQLLMRTANIIYFGGHFGFLRFAGDRQVAFFTPARIATTSRPWLFDATFDDREETAGAQHSATP